MGSEIVWAGMLLVNVLSVVSSTREEEEKKSLKLIRIK
jgi:hypothetical protein